MHKTLSDVTYFLTNLENRIRLISDYKYYAKRFIHTFLRIDTKAYTTSKYLNLVRRNTSILKI